MKNHDAIFRVPARGDAFEAALEGLTRVNVGLMGEQQLPPLYQAGVRYRDEPRDVWRHAVDVAGEKWGDCEDLAAYRAAELRVSGEDPDARVAVYQSGPSRYHAVVARSGGLVEDPSRALGMGQKKGATMHPRRKTNVIGDDPTPGDALTFEIVKIPGKGWGGSAGWRGYLRLPLPFLTSTATGLPQALMTIGPQASTPQAATTAAAKAAADHLLNNPEVQAALAKVPAVSQAAAVLTNPSVVAALKNPASLLNLQTALARPDIAVQNVAKVAEGIKNLFHL